MSENSIDAEVVSKKKKWLVPAIIGAVFAVIIVIVITAIIATTAPKRALKKQLDAGEKYLADLDYENAILAYEEALKIDPKCEDAYLKLSSIYISLAEEKKAAEDYEGASDLFNKAADVVQEGVNQTGSQQIKDELEEVNREIQENEELIEKSKVLELSAENFPDEAFRNFISDRFDVDQDGALNAEEIASVKELSYKPWTDGDFYVNDFSGIGYFSNLEVIDWYDYMGNSIDLSDNHELKKLSLSPSTVEGDGQRSTYIESIDISNNPKLTYIYLEFSTIKKLDCSNNSELEEIYVSDTDIEELVLPNNPKLKTLDAAYTNLKFLDISHCPKLVELIQNAKRIEVPSLTTGYLLYLEETGENTQNLILTHDSDVELITE